MTTPAATPWTLLPGGVMLNVRLTPKGGRDAIETVERLADGSCVLKARVRALPMDGAANEALRRLIASTLGVAPGRVHLVGGATARIKRIRIEGEPAHLVAALEAIAAS